MERNRIASWWIRWADLDWPNQDNMDKIKRRAEGLAKARALAGEDGVVVAAGSLYFAGALRTALGLPWK